MLPLFSPLIFSTHISPPTLPDMRIFSSTPHFSIDCICSVVCQRGSWRRATFLWLSVVLEGAASQGLVFWCECFVILCSTIVGGNLPFSSIRTVVITDNCALRCYGLWTGATRTNAPVFLREADAEANTVISVNGTFGM